MFEHQAMDDAAVKAAHDAGLNAGRYCIPDPVYWIEQAGLAGVEFAISDDEELVTSFLDADFLQATFLEAWLSTSAEATSAVIAILQKRGIPGL